MKRRLALCFGFAALLVTGCADDSVVSTGALPPPSYDAGLVHVHGLGVDPGDGVLYAASHSGLFRVPEAGPAVRVANRDQDTMGFSVVGPGAFIGSGHPDRREDDVRPPLLGLVESHDRGETWDRLSLHGKADFHVLRYAHSLTFGYDSTSASLMVTKDRRTWQTQSQLNVRDFAVSPATPDVLLATTGGGLIRSGDRGKTWTSATAPARLSLLAWPQPTLLIAASGEGQIFASTDGGKNWQQRGDAGGAVEALTYDVATETVFVAVAERGILKSSDGGRTFAVRYAS